ncbi:MAG TPA: rhodanese-like domain-containing protein [Terriglobia bacterium]|nr:rhodanese-like domain-containing protein [Terriglobia bacterium]
MKRIVRPAILALCALTTTLLALPQKHPPVASGVQETAAKKLHSMLGHNGKVLAIDVRTPAEYAGGHVPEAVNIPINELPQKLRQMQVSKDTTIVTLCDHGGRSSRAALELRKMGYKATSFCRIDAWQKDGYKITKGDTKPRSE